MDMISYMLFKAMFIPKSLAAFLDAVESGLLPGTPNRTLDPVLIVEYFLSSMSQLIMQEFLRIVISLSPCFGILLSLVE